jgi:Tol biopolymer transport system component
MRSFARHASLALVATLAASPSFAQQPATWDVTQPRGTTREIDFTTTEGTWMSVDVSPDGQWLVFDLLGHIYRMPASGGEAVALTQASGIAINTHPRISPDGKLIAFISDRRGQNNLWVMNADGSNPRPIFTDLYVRAVTPAWSADGDYIVVQRSQLPNAGAPGGGGIWMYHKDGGAGVELLPGSKQPASWPSLSRDGKYLYFQVTNQGSQLAGYGGRGDFLSGSAQVRRMEIRTGDISAVSYGEQQQQVQASSGGMGAPEVSPDGKWLAFVRRIPDGTISWKGHTFGPRSALWLRNLETGHERLVMDPVEQDIFEGGKVLRPFPGYSWSRDGKAIYLTQGGKLRRLDVASGVVTTIPFTARVKRTISQLANFQVQDTSASFPVRFTRWASASPDGKRLAFQAVGRVWVMDLPQGTPKRVTTDAFTPFEYAPAWSPDGQWLAFTSWDDTVSAHLWKVRAAGGTPERLTRDAGEYIHPSWSADGREIVLARGAGESRHGRGVVWNQYWDVVRVSSAGVASGGEAQFVTRVTNNGDASAGSAFNSIRNQIVRPAYGPDGRIFYLQLFSTGPSTESTLYSVRPDGSDRRAHVSFPLADEAMVSPDGKWLAFQESDNVWVSPFVAGGSGGTPIRIDRNRPKLPATRLTSTGGLFPTWRNDSTLDYGSADRFFSYRPASKRADTTRIALTVPKEVPAGTVAFTNARLVTLNKRAVVNGTLVVRGNRIACVGAAASRPGRASSTPAARRSSPASSTCTRTTIASIAESSRSTTTRGRSSSRTGSPPRWTRRCGRRTSFPPRSWSRRGRSSVHASSPPAIRSTPATARARRTSRRRNSPRRGS